jgi:hypothetical protein
MVGNWWRSRRCRAKTRKGTHFLAKTMKNGGCKNHGGMSTGPRTEAGRTQQARAARETMLAWRARKRAEEGRDA